MKKINFYKKEMIGVMPELVEDKLCCPECGFELLFHSYYDLSINNELSWDIDLTTGKVITCPKCRVKINWNNEKVPEGFADGTECYVLSSIQDMNDFIKKQKTKKIKSNAYIVDKSFIKEFLYKQVTTSNPNISEIKIYNLFVDEESQLAECELEYYVDDILHNRALSKKYAEYEKMDSTDIQKVYLPNEYVDYLENEIKSKIQSDIIMLEREEVEEEIRCLQNTF